MLEHARITKTQIDSKLLCKTWQHTNVFLWWTEAKVGHRSCHVLGWNILNICDRRCPFDKHSYPPDNLIDGFKLLLTAPDIAFISMTPMTGRFFLKFREAKLGVLTLWRFKWTLLRLQKCPWRLLCLPHSPLLYERLHAVVFTQPSKVLTPLLLRLSYWAFECGSQLWQKVK